MQAFQIFCRSLNGKSLTLDVCSSHKIHAVKAAIEQKTGMRIADQVLAFTTCLSSHLCHSNNATVNSTSCAPNTHAPELLCCSSQYIMSMSSYAQRLPRPMLSKIRYETFRMFRRAITSSVRKVSEDVYCVMALLTTGPGVLWQAA